MDSFIKQEFLVVTLFEILSGYDVNRNLKMSLNIKFHIILKNSLTKVFIVKYIVIFFPIKLGQATYLI